MGKHQAFLILRVLTPGIETEYEVEIRGRDGGAPNRQASFGPRALKNQRLVTSVAAR